MTTPEDLPVSDPENIVRALAQIVPEDIITSGYMGGRPWVKCTLCKATDRHARHEIDCPWVQARLWMYREVWQAMREVEAGNDESAP